mmetsp:Transcript_28372/g.57364  ORF Transcript_28372/g.57364 Transcript_28372/m.57364 type:complete len:297 (-) Transcript_28372:267-1157(-)
MRLVVAAVELADLLAEVSPEHRVAEVRLLVELQRDELGRSRLLPRLPERREQRVAQCALHGDAAARRELQHLLEELQGGRRRAGEPRRDAFALPAWASADVLLGVVALQLADVLLRRRPEDVEDHVELVGAAFGVEAGVVAVPPVRREREAGGAREERAAVLQACALEHLQELAVDAAHGPNVDGVIVVVLQQDQLGRAVPPRHHVPRHGPLRAARRRHDRPLHLALRALLAGRVGQRRLALRVDGAGEAEVADADGAVLVDQAVGRLQVSVVDARGVEVLEAHEEVVEDGVYVQG